MNYLIQEGIEVMNNIHTVETDLLHLQIHHQTATFNLKLNPNDTDTINAIKEINEKISIVEHGKKDLENQLYEVMSELGVTEFPHETAKGNFQHYLEQQTVNAL